MPVNTRELIEAIAVLAEEENVRVTDRQSAKVAAITGASSFLGGILLGPVGILGGAVFGGLAAFGMTRGTFRPLSDVILNDLTEKQRKKLVKHIKNAVKDIRPTDFAMLLLLIRNDESVQMTVLKAVISFVSKELNMRTVKS